MYITTDVRQPCDHLLMRFMHKFHILSLIHSIEMHTILRCVCVGLKMAI